MFRHGTGMGGEPANTCSGGIGEDDLLPWSGHPTIGRSHMLSNRSPHFLIRRIGRLDGVIGKTGCDTSSVCWIKRIWCSARTRAIRCRTLSRYKKEIITWARELESGREIENLHTGRRTSLDRNRSIIRRSDSLCAFNMVVSHLFLLFVLYPKARNCARTFPTEARVPEMSSASACCPYRVKDNACPRSPPYVASVSPTVNRVSCPAS